ncbi:MAG TPA: carboxypeptidase-like regulatory domain-containing protein [Candidatus Angelobacter sp.]|nr:carboxypeptidase-like regulatory domain-containing protein [Candidatus Angelobacter sp.]
MKARAPVILFTLFASFIIPVIIGNVYASSCPPGNCQAAVSSNVPSSDGTIWVEVDNNTGNVVPLPQTFNFPYNTTHTITVLNNTFTGSSTGGHYVWKDWANYFGTTTCPGNQCVWTTNPMLRISSGPPNGILYNYTSTAGFTAVFDKQFQYTLSFNDAAGNPLSPAPTSVVLSAQTGGPITITQYSGFLNSNLYTVSQATWEGSTLGTTSPVQIDLTTGSATKTVSLQAYTASVHVVDNNNNPIIGANVTVTFINSTSRSFITNSKGNVQLGDVPRGSYSLSVMYQNQQVTGVLENAITNPTATVQLNVGSTATSTTTSAIVLLTIFGLAFFLILLAIKVRKPPPPPTI